MSEASVQKVLGVVNRTAWIITSSADGQMSGLVATFVNNASLVIALPRLLAGIATHHFTADLIRRSRSFAAHLVDEGHLELIWRFGLGSGRDADKFAGLRWHRGPTGSPVLEDALAWLDCSVEGQLDIGDRTVYVAMIVDGDVNRSGAAVTSQRLWELASAEERRHMQEERDRDEKVDAAAILDWRRLNQRGE